MHILNVGMKDDLFFDQNEEQGCSVSNNIGIRNVHCGVRLSEKQTTSTDF